MKLPKWINKPTDPVHHIGMWLFHLIFMVCELIAVLTLNFVRPVWAANFLTSFTIWMINRDAKKRNCMDRRTT